MGNLISEKRVDRNGNLVTRHVRATPKQGAGRSAMPQPSLGSAASPVAPRRAFKPREKQRAQSHQSHNVDKYPFDSRLVTDQSEKDEEAARQNRWYSRYYTFKASEVEIYDVLSVAPIGEALRMLSRGVRSADEARQHLIDHGAGDLIIDRKSVMDEALEKNVSHYDFVSRYAEINNDYGDTEHLVDCVLFGSSSLSEGYNASVMDRIASGMISFDDIKAVGITKLKTHDRAYHLSNAFKALHEGESGYTVDNIKTLIARAQDEDFSSADWSHLSRFMDKIGISETLKFNKLKNLRDAFLTYFIAPGANRFEEDRDERAFFSAKVRDGISRYTLSTTFTDQFFEAGIPVEATIDVVSRGGGLREAIAIHEEGIAGSVSGGWL